MNNKQNEIRLSSCTPHSSQKLSRMYPADVVIRSSTSMPLAKYIIYIPITSFYSINLPCTPINNTRQRTPPGITYKPPKIIHRNLAIMALSATSTRTEILGKVYKMIPPMLEKFHKGWFDIPRVG